MENGRPIHESWWTRPAGGREVLSLALPMVVSTLSWTMMIFIDSIILQRYVSGAAMSAQFSASMIWFASISLFFGICSYVSTFVSQYFGDRQNDKIGPVTWQGVWLALFFFPIAVALRPLAPHLFAAHDPEVAALEIHFFQLLCWGAPGMLAAQALEAFFSGQGRTRTVMAVDALAVLVNVILACVLVLGLFNITSWGIDGAAWATVTAQWSRALMYVVLIMHRANREKFNTLRGMRLDLPLMARLIRYAGPSGMQMFLDIAGFALFVQMVGKLGLVDYNATALVFRISYVAFMPVWGLGMATAVLVGQKLGENRPDLSSRAAHTTLGMALGYMAFISALFTLTPNVFLSSFFTHGEVSASETAVRSLSIELLRYVSAYNMFDAAIIIFVSVLRGAGDTRFVMLVSGCMATALAAASYLGVEEFGMTIYQAWILITAWVWIVAVIYVLRYRQGKWRSMRVIDQVHAPPSEAPSAEDPPGEDPLQRSGASAVHSI